MVPRRIASIGAVVGGLAWVARVLLSWLDDGSTDGGLATAMFLVGALALVVASAAAGYTLVEHAPLWLRVVVVVALPLLLIALFAAVDDAVRTLTSEDGWVRGNLTVLVAALIALVVGGLKVRGSGRDAGTGAGHGKGRAHGSHARH